MAIEDFITVTYAVARQDCTIPLPPIPVATIRIAQEAGGIVDPAHYSGPVRGTWDGLAGKFSWMVPKNCYIHLQCAYTGVSYFYALGTADVNLNNVNLNEAIPQPPAPPPLTADDFVPYEGAVKDIVLGANRQISAGDVAGGTTDVAVFAQASVSLTEVGGMRSAALSGGALDLLDLTTFDGVNISIDNGITVTTDGASSAILGDRVTSAMFQCYGLTKLPSPANASIVFDAASNEWKAWDKTAWKSLAADVSGLVPYTGATADLDVGSFGIYGGGFQGSYMEAIGPVQAALFSTNVPGPATASAASVSLNAPSSTVSGAYRLTGMDVSVEMDGSASISGFGTGITGLSVASSFDSSGVAGSVTGLKLSVSNTSTGTITNALGLGLSFKNASIIGTAKGLTIAPPPGTLTDWYGLQVSETASTSGVNYAADLSGLTWLHGETEKRVLLVEGGAPSANIPAATFNGNSAGSYPYAPIVEFQTEGATVASVKRDGSITAVGAITIGDVSGNHVVIDGPSQRISMKNFFGTETSYWDGSAGNLTVDGNLDGLSVHGGSLTANWQLVVEDGGTHKTTITQPTLAADINLKLPTSLPPAGRRGYFAVDDAGNMAFADIPIIFCESRVDQPITSATQDKAIVFEVENVKYGIDHSNTVNPSRFTFTEAGVYTVALYAQAQATTNNQNMDFWFKLDGVNLPYSLTRAGLQTANAQYCPAVGLLLTAAAGQYLEAFMWGSATACLLNAIAAGVTPTRPAAPSVYIYIRRQG